MKRDRNYQSILYTLRVSILLQNVVGNIWYMFVYTGLHSSQRLGWWSCIITPKSQSLTTIYFSPSWICRLVRFSWSWLDLAEFSWGWLQAVGLVWVYSTGLSAYSRAGEAAQEVKANHTGTFKTTSLLTFYWPKHVTCQNAATAVVGSAKSHGKGCGCLIPTQSVKNWEQKSNSPQVAM